LWDILADSCFDRDCIRCGTDHAIADRAISASEAKEMSKATKARLDARGICEPKTE
jgi:hypothetical protein